MIIKGFWNGQCGDPGLLRWAQWKLKGPDKGKREAWESEWGNDVMMMEAEVRLMHFEDGVMSQVIQVVSGSS